MFSVSHRNFPSSYLSCLCPCEAPIATLPRKSSSFLLQFRETEWRSLHTEESELYRWLFAFSHTKSHLGQYSFSLDWNTSEEDENLSSREMQDCKAHVSAPGVRQGGAGVWHSLCDLCLAEQEKHVKIKASVSPPLQATWPFLGTEFLWLLTLWILVIKATFLLCSALPIYHSHTSCD